MLVVQLFLQFKNVRHPEQNNFSVFMGGNGARTGVRRSAYKVYFLESDFTKICYVSTNFSINP